MVHGLRFLFPLTEHVRVSKNQGTKGPVLRGGLCELKSKSTKGRERGGSHITRSLSIGAAEKIRQSARGWMGGECSFFTLKVPLCCCV